MRHTRPLALVLVLVLGSVVLAAKKPGSSPILGLSARNWTTLAAPSNNFPLGNNAAGDLVFTFPTDPAASINYLYTPRVPSSLVPYGTLSLQLGIVILSGAPVFNFVFADDPGNTCPGYATAYPFFIANRNDWSGEFSRWWSNPRRFVLREGMFGLDVPLTPDAWSSVYGKFGTTDADSMAGWTQALGHVSAIGVTFGGGCFFGHGVNVVAGTGQAQFVLRDARVF